VNKAGQISSKWVYSFRQDKEEGNATGAEREPHAGCVSRQLHRVEV